MLRTLIIIALESGVVSPDFIIVQGLNGVAYGLLIFLLAAGLTLIFGMLHVVNLAHGSFFMIGPKVECSRGAIADVGADHDDRAVGQLHVVNLAHGSFFMIGAYIGYSAARALNFWAALLVAPIVVGLVGVIIE